MTFYCDILGVFNLKVSKSADAHWIAKMFFSFNSPAFIYLFWNSHSARACFRKEAGMNSSQLKFVSVIRAHCVRYSLPMHAISRFFLLICCNRMFDDDDDEGIARVAKYGIRVELMLFLRNNGSLQRWMTVVKNRRRAMKNIWFNVFLTDIHYRPRVHI